MERCALIIRRQDGAVAASSCLGNDVSSGMSGGVTFTLTIIRFKIFRWEDTKVVNSCRRGMGIAWLLCHDCVAKWGQGGRRPLTGQGANRENVAGGDYREGGVASYPLRDSGG